MPLIKVSTNVALSLDSKRALAAALTDVFATCLKSAAAHTHVQVVGDEFLSLGGNADAAAALEHYDLVRQVTVKAAENSITKDARKDLVPDISQVLLKHIKHLTGERIYMTFDELPVQNFAVGDSIMTFDTMHTAKSAENLPEIAP